ncbi:hypothetical protein [Plantactinospora endophytica]|uniref:Uncharacterized protein n=1 Tax=Plantactinospora endophytica TaxID=673535 RepID=A0ABQ4EF82_9ACTN|nr:hypothetical protein Pen02_83210 [Plantactinospora endophytica]
MKFSLLCGHPAPVRGPLRTTREVDIWIERLRRFWNQRLDALGVELARGRRERREPHRDSPAGSSSTDNQPSIENEEDT